MRLICALMLVAGAVLPTTANAAILVIVDAAGFYVTHYDLDVSCKFMGMEVGTEYLASGESGSGIYDQGEICYD